MQSQTNAKLQFTEAKMHRIGFASGTNFATFFFCYSPKEQKGKVTPPFLSAYLPTVGNSPVPMLTFECMENKKSYRELVTFASVFCKETHSFTRLELEQF